MNRTFTNPDREGPFLGFETLPASDSGFEQHIVYVHVERVYAVSFADIGASWLHAGDEAFRLVGRPFDIVNALNEGRHAYLRELG